MYCFGRHHYKQTNLRGMSGNDAVLEVKLTSQG